MLRSIAQVVLLADQITDVPTFLHHDLRKVAGHDYKGGTNSARHDLSAIEVDRLEGRLYDHNRRATGRDDGKGLAFVAVDERGGQIGAIAGYTWADQAAMGGRRSPRQRA
jgi:hypothetical protein